MLVFSRVPEPSSLLWTNDKDLSPGAQTLLAQCKNVTVLQQPGTIDLLWQRAKDLDAQGDSAGCAIVLLSLAENFQRYFRPGPALRCVERAEAILGKWPNKKHRQNHAAALYACGIVYQLLGSYQEASDAYCRALAAFKEARAQWPSLRVTAEFGDKCIAAQHLIEELSAYVARAATFGDSGAMQFCNLMTYWLAERNPAGEVQTTLSIAIEEVAVGMQLRVIDPNAGLQNYEFRRLTGRKGLKLEPQLGQELDQEYGVVKIPPQIAKDPVGQAGAPVVLKNAAYALVQEGYALVPKDARAKIYGIGSERVKAEELLWGEFSWDTASKKVSFTALYQQDSPIRPPRFVGERNLDPSASGTIIGVFK